MKLREVPAMNRSIRNLRWWIGGLLFASTVINYIDCQTLSLLAPDLKRLYSWTNSDYAALRIAFRIAYSIGQTVFGRILDRVGTKVGLTATVACYSVISILTSLANGFGSFVSFRFLLGLGESGNWPGAAKAVSEWFPNRDRGLATAFFNSGSSIGGVIAPFIVLFVYYHLTFFLIGRLTDSRVATGAHVFDPIIVIAGLIPFIGMVLVLLLVRNTTATEVLSREFDPDGC
jgi:sugar phosphate permease